MWAHSAFSRRLTSLAAVWCQWQRRVMADYSLERLLLSLSLPPGKAPLTEFCSSGSLPELLSKTWALSLLVEPRPPLTRGATGGCPLLGEVRHRDSEPPGPC